MDVEGGEWSILESVFQSGVLANVKQLGFEIHTMSMASTTVKTFFEHWKTLKRLETFGFRRWYWHFNFYGAYIYRGRARSCCYELVYINVNFMSKNPEAKQSKDKAMEQFAQDSVSKNQTISSTKIKPIAANISADTV